MSGRTSTSLLTLLSSRREPSLLGHWHKLDGASGHPGGIHFHKHGTARGRATEAGLEQRPAEEIEIARFCANHRRPQRASGDIGVALCRYELDAAVSTYHFGCSASEDITRAHILSDRTAHQPHNGCRDRCD